MKEYWKFVYSRLLPKYQEQGFTVIAIPTIDGFSEIFGMTKDGEHRSIVIDHQELQEMNIHTLIWNLDNLAKSLEDALLAKKKAAEKETHNSSAKILSTEYSEQFDNIRKNQMIASYYKYGKVKENYSTNKNIDAVKSLEKRLDKYKQTGNTEFLADIANFAMIEFMFPQTQGAHYTPTDSSDSCGVYGMGINEAKDFKEGE